jgi:glycosyltransferase involved in cell wall biosynthesis
VTVAVLNTVAGLEQVGVSSEVITTDDDGPGRRRAVRSDAECGSSYRSPVRFFPRQTEFYSTSLPMLPWLLRNVGRYDLVHVHGLFNFAPGAAVLAAALRRTPYVVQPHGVLERWGREQRRPWLKQHSIRLFEGPLLRRAGAVVFTSDQERQQALGLSLPRRQAIIPLGVTLQDAAAVAADPGFDVLRDRPWALFLGRIDEKKGVERLLTAFATVRARLPTAMLVIAGEGAPRYVDSLRTRARELQVDDALLWPGFVAGTTKQWLLQNCGLFVLASSSENFCLAAVEAMAAGRPVVLSSGVAVAEIVARWQAGRVTSLAPTEIADAMCAVLADPTTAAVMGRCGRHAVASELTLGAHGRGLAQLYRDVLAGHP